MESNIRLAAVSVSKLNETLSSVSVCIYACRAVKQASIFIVFCRAVRIVLEHLAVNPREGSHLVVASHNERSIRLAAQTMKLLDISPQNSLVSFAQIYGMAEYLSAPLGTYTYTRTFIEYLNKLA